MTETGNKGATTEGSEAVRREPTAADRELLNRYVAGQLTPEEFRTIEGRLVADPDFRRELELTEALRGGLRELSLRGELLGLLAPQPRFWQQPSYALAASIVAGLAGVTALALYGQLQDSRDSVATLRQQVAGTSVTPTQRSVSLNFDPPRGVNDAGEVTWLRTADPTLVELRLDVGYDPAPSYIISVKRLADGGAVQLLEMRSATLIVANNVGEVSVKLHSSILAVGHYTITLAPDGSLTSASQLRKYTLRVLE